MNRFETFRKSSHPWIDQTQFIDRSQSEILSQVVENKEQFKCSRGRPSAVVFDLDSTLFEVRYRTLRIMQEFARKNFSRTGKGAAILDWMRTVRAGELLYGLEASIRAAGFTEEEIAESGARKEFRDFWFSRFFANAYLLSDRPAAGAREYVRKLKSLNIKIIYLSGRDWPGMGDGTIASLRHHGFPMGKSESLVLKPKFSEDDAEFKERALKEIDEKNLVLALFDNEPRNFNAFKKVLPDAQLVFCHTVCSTADATPLHGVGRIFDFVE